MRRTASTLLLALGLIISGCAPAEPTPAGAEEPLAPGTEADSVIAEGRVEPVRYAEIALSASGLVSKVLLQEDDEVNAGDLIAQLEASQTLSLEDAQANALTELTAAYEAVRDAQYELDNFDVPSDFSGQSATEAVRSTREKLDAAREAFEPYEDLSERRVELTARERQDESKIYRDTAKLFKKRLDDAWSKYRTAITWLEHDSALEAAAARLDQAQENYDALLDPSFSEDTAGLRAALANAELRAPFAGVITQLDLKVGEFASAGQPVVTIADMTSWVVRTTDLTELDVVSIREGADATILLDAIPNEPIAASVMQISQGYSEKQGDIVYEVTLVLAEVPPGIRWGMTAEVRFDM